MIPSASAVRCAKDNHTYNDDASVVEVVSSSEHVNCDSSKCVDVHFYFDLIDLDELLQVLADGPRDAGTSVLCSMSYERRDSGTAAG